MSEEINHDRRGFLVVAAMTVAAAQLGVTGCVAQQTTRAAAQLPIINWLRTLPYVRAWGEKYKGQGLVVIGVHTPEFAFEKNIDNIRRAARDMRIVYPAAVDSEYAIWRAFENQYWPALYFVAAQGRIRHQRGRLHTKRQG